MVECFSPYQLSECFSPYQLSERLCADLPQSKPRHTSAALCRAPPIELMEHIYPCYKAFVAFYMRPFRIQTSVTLFRPDSTLLPSLRSLQPRRSTTAKRLCYGSYKSRHHKVHPNKLGWGKLVKTCQDPCLTCRNASSGCHLSRSRPLLYFFAVARRCQRRYQN